jgi:hypothetical protein
VRTREHYRQWINAVHEDIETKEPAAKHDLVPAELQVIHLPENNKRGSPTRNRRHP